MFTDQKWIGFILNQLVLNCAKYKRETDACIRTVTEKLRGSVLLKITDNGIGIRAEELPWIFEKGFTETNGRQTACLTGMGLYLWHKLCKKFGIKMRVTFVEEGRNRDDTVSA